MAKRKVPLGKAIEWTDEEIEEFSEYEDEDIIKLRHLWYKYAPAVLRNLIDAQLKEEIDA